MSSQNKSIYLTSESIRMIEEMRTTPQGYQVSASQIIERAVRTLYVMAKEGQKGE